MQFNPISCLRPNPRAAQKFATPPYDVFTHKTARIWAQNHPQSFITIDRPEVNFPQNYHDCTSKVYAKASDLLGQRLLDSTLLADPTDCFYAWRLSTREHSQLGIVGAVSVSDYLNGTIKQHEAIRPKKLYDRVEHMKATAVQASPVLMMHPANPTLSLIVNASIAANPLYDFMDTAGIHHRIWRIARPDAVAALCALYERIPTAYIADGHHRAAAAVKVAQTASIDSSRAAASNQFLAVLFNAEDLTTLPYHRLIHDTNTMSSTTLIKKIMEAGIAVTPVVSDASESATPPQYAQDQHVRMFVDNTWYDLNLGTLTNTQKDTGIAADLLQRYILAPVLGIEDPTNNARISFIGGTASTTELQEAAQTAAGVIFSPAAVRTQQIMEIADANKLMPPKSTWFEPKLLSGLFIRQI
ncbi:DUF1015 domain-containing protein [Atopobium fossor]|uniref:DUF1015 domain-containing protein n=1 Tax=Atopobium fossor TaxID=39487 RepID=UPI000422AA36|nr:DUF1015 domain-containing protein [Atopobium fossor]